MTNRRKPDGIDAVDSIAWDLADRATRRLALETLEVLDTRRVVERLAERYLASQNAHRAGHLFEVMHALSFNRDAIAQRSGVRAVVAEWAVGGSQTAASDIDLIHNGTVVAQVQAKLYDAAPGAAFEISNDKFTDMQRLLAGDRVDAVASLLDKRLTLNPDGLNIERFQDARAHVTGVLHHDGLSSKPVAYSEAHAAAVDPKAWINDEVREAMATELLVGVAAAAGAGAALDALISAASSAATVRAGETPAMEAAITACAAAGRTAARSGATAAVGGGVKLAAQLGRLPGGLATGTLPMAMGGAVVGVAEAAFAYACADIDRAELATRCASVTAKTSIVWAFSAIGQTAIPIPVVGSLAGGFVGQLVGAQCVRGLQMAVIAARQAKVGDQRLAALEEELLTAAVLTEELSQLTTRVGVRSDAYLGQVVMPRLDEARRALVLGEDDHVLGRFADIVAALGQEPLFTTMQEFDAWMADKHAVLTLDGNW